MLVVFGVTTVVAQTAMQCLPHMACARVVSAGTAYYSCAVVYDNVDERGQLKCWGTGGPQLGLGDTDTRGDQLSDMGAALPAVDVGVGRFVVTVSNAATHTCAVLDNRRVKCWGDNSDWQLGYGDKYTRGHSSATMGEALPFVDIGTDYEAVDVCAAGVSPNWSYSCALSTAGSVKCWGSGHVISADTEIGSSWHLGTTPAEMGDNLPAINLGTSRYVTQLTCAKYDVCVILDNNQIKCWGQTSNFGGHQVAVMGDNLVALDMSTVQTGDIKIVSIDSGDAHHCVLLSSGAVACWGANDYRQTGHPLFTTHPVPQQIVSLGTGRTATQITCGGLHSCALLDNGDVKCWGRNNLGQLGLGDTADRGSVEANMGDNLPTVSLSSTLTTLAVYAGHEHTCALLSDHQLRCWGTNNEAVLGIGEDYWDTWNEIGDEPGEMGDALVAVDLAIDVANTCVLPSLPPHVLPILPMDIPSTVCSAPTTTPVPEPTTTTSTPVPEPITTTSTPVPEPIATTSTVEGLVSTTPVATQSMSTITFVITMAMSLAEFDSTKRGEYMAGVAQALAVPLGSVAIGLVTETVSRRRLLVTTIEVETVVTVPSEDTGSIEAKVTPENINGALASAGMTVDGVTQPVVAGLGDTLPIELHEWVLLDC